MLQFFSFVIPFWYGNQTGLNCGLLISKGTYVTNLIILKVFEYMMDALNTVWAGYRLWQFRFCMEMGTIVRITFCVIWLGKISPVTVATKKKEVCIEWYQIFPSIGRILFLYRWNFRNFGIDPFCMTRGRPQLFTSIWSQFYETPFNRDSSSHVP